MQRPLGSFAGEGAVSNEAFLSAIRQAPEDDGLRLVYADWLEEHGDESDRARAEFIRAQVDLERLPMDAPGRSELEDRADDLLAAFEERWLTPLPAHLVEWTWRRGFLDEVHFHGQGSVEDMVRLCAAHPPSGPRQTRSECRPITGAGSL